MTNPEEHPEITRLKRELLFRAADERSYQSLFVRAALRIDREFLSVNFRQKIQFFLYGFRWIGTKLYQRLRGEYWRIRAQRLPKEAFPPIAVILRGGIGDLVNASAFLTAFHEKWPLSFDVYFFNPSAAKFIFAKAPFVKHIFSLPDLEGNKKNYEAIMTVNDWLNFEVVDTTKASLLVQQLSQHFEKNKTQFQSFDGIAKTWNLFASHFLLSEDYIDTVLKKSLNRVTAPGCFLDLPIESAHLKIYPNTPNADYLETIGLKPGCYITVHDGFDNQACIRNKASTKQWPLSRWETFIRLFKEKAPEYKVVQLGGKNSRALAHVDLSLINQATLDEIAWILQHAKCHIDGESGLVRVAKTLGTRSVVLFGPTPLPYYGISGNINVAPKACGGCAGLTPDWMAQCPRGLPEPECMHSIHPEEVFQRVKELCFV